MRRLYHNGFDVSGGLKQSGSYVDVAFPIYTSSIDVEYLLIGGGGGGACEDDFYSRGPGGGGGAGGVNSGSFNLVTGSTDLTLKVGPKGEGGIYAGSGDGDGLNGYSSYISGIASVQSGSHGNTVHGDTSVSATGGKSGTPLNGGNGSTNDLAGGGGGGASSAGTSGGDDTSSGVGGNGGNGLTINDWYIDASTPLGQVAGGGGGGAAGAFPVTGSGAFGGGNGNGSNATTFGSGGGGSYRTDAGDGAGGLVLLRYQAIRQINNSGDSIYKVGDYWYHKFATPSQALQTFERPSEILIDF